MRWLITGAHGFIGTNFVRFLHSHTKEIAIVDCNTYAADPTNLADLNLKTYTVDISNYEHMKTIFDLEKPNIVINFAAESHVDRSIEGPQVFIKSNVLGTSVLLTLSLQSFTRFVQISTDEVYGSVEQQGGVAFNETMALIPSSPYSASKASADLLLKSFVHTYKMDALITRCSNNYGPYQHPEKLLPKCIINAHLDNQIPVYGSGLNKRDWIHVSDHCKGIYLAAINGKAGEVYNFGGACCIPNIDLVKKVIHKQQKTETLISFVEDRKGHDMTYAVNFAKSKKELGWQPEIPFEVGLQGTIEWYLQNQKWWKPKVALPYSLQEGTVL